MTIREFWREAGLFPQAALVTAGTAAVLNAETYLGLRARGPFAAIYALHLLIMLLLLAMFALTAYERAVAARRSPVGGVQEAPKAPLPKSLVWGAVGSAVYLLALFAYAFAVFGEGGPELRDGRDVWVGPAGVTRGLRPGELRAFECLELRLFSAGWLFFALVVALAGHRVLTRLRWRRASIHQAAA